MAAPGYPQMGQMPPGMGGQMGGPPMGGAQMQQMRPIRRGAPKAVPVVVAAGLAVGVFCGLLFGVGTGKNTALAAGASGNNVKKASDEEAKPEPGAAPKGMGATTALPVPKAGSAAGSGSATAVASAGSAAGSAAPAAGSGAGSAKPAVEEKKIIKLTFKLKPDGVDKDAKVTIDGKPIDGLIAEVPSDTKSYKLEIKANGYRTFEKKMDIAMPEDMEVQLELQKKPASTGGGTHPIKRPDRPTNAGGNGGGLIDI